MYMLLLVKETGVLLPLVEKRGREVLLPRDLDDIKYYKYKISLPIQCPIHLS